MKFLNMKKVGEGKFLTRYDLTYETAEKKEKVYEIVSRHKNMKTFEDLKSAGPDAVVVVAYDRRGRILLNREYRMAVGGWVYNFPAGLIEKGESVQEAAARELREETGLHLDRVLEVMQRTYGAAGISDESTVVLLAEASGDFAPSTSAEEEIEAGWFSKEQVAEMLRTEIFASRTQAWCYMWVNGGRIEGKEDQRFPK